MKIPKTYMWLKNQAMQDQEKAKAKDWVKYHLETSDKSRAHLLELYHAINDSDPAKLRALSDKHLQVICSLALVALMDTL